MRWLFLEWERLTPLTRYANPFLQVFEGGAAGGVALLSMWNLLNAVADLRIGESLLDRATQSNFVGAVLGTGSVINGALMATKAITPAIF